MSEKKNEINNVKELRDDLRELYKELRQKKIGLREAKELNNTAGKIMNSAKLQMEYNNFTKSGQKIEFLTSDK
jgi:hypothetical protein